MLLEVHRCDICGELVYIPEESLAELRLIEKSEYTIDYDVCILCKEALFKWILEIRQKK
jgi:hypothetical protein